MTAGLVIVQGAVAAYNASRHDAAATNRAVRHCDRSPCRSAARIHQDMYSASASTKTIGQTTIWSCWIERGEEANSSVTIRRILSVRMTARAPAIPDRRRRQLAG